MELIKFSDSIDEVAAAHSAFLGQVLDVGKDQKGYGYKYADLAQILSASRPALEANDLSLTQFPTFAMWPADQRMELPADSKGFCPAVIGEVIIVTTLAHSSGQYMQGSLSIPVETMKNLSVAQAVGAAISYARRYHASSILGIAQEDNDAAQKRDDSPQGAAANYTKAPRQAPRQQAPKPQAQQAPRIAPGDVEELRLRIEKMGRNPAQFAKAVAGMKSLDELPATALEAAQKMLAKAEAMHYLALKEAEAAQAAEQNADQSAGQYEDDQRAAQVA